jgi:hypothetical protein
MPRVNRAVELLLGLKIENKRALSNVEATLRVPEIGFADSHDEPYPPAMLEARVRVLASCKANGVGFLSGVYSRDVVERIEEGATVPSSRDGLEAAEVGRRFTNRTMPW